MGKPKDAVEALTKYLAEDPKATDRTTQETRIANLKNARRRETTHRHPQRARERPPGAERGAPASCIVDSAPN